MDFQDLEFLPSTFVTNCGGGESLLTTTCLRAVVEVSKGMFPV